jgi:hypothetical protein
MSTLSQEMRTRQFVLRGDRDRRASQGVARILIERTLFPARDHHPDVRAIAHAVRIQRPLDLAGELRAVHSDIQADLPGAPVEPIEVLLEEKRRALVQPEPFPDTIADNEAAVEERDLRGITRDQRAIQVNE